jgi:ATP-dependent Lon protease
MGYPLALGNSNSQVESLEPSRNRYASQAALLILGDMSIQGNFKPLRLLTKPLQVAKANGAKRALIPIENKRNFLDVSADIMEQVNPIFYGDPKIAAHKVLGVA